MYHIVTISIRYSGELITFIGGGLNKTVALRAAQELEFAYLEQMERMQG